MAALNLTDQGFEFVYAVDATDPANPVIGADISAGNDFYLNSLDASTFQLSADLADADPANLTPLGDTALGNVTVLSTSAHAILIHTASGDFVLSNAPQTFPLATSMTVYDGNNNVWTGPDVPCFLAGTAILTNRGKVAVEDLKAGDEVLTLSHEFKPVKWIGKRSYVKEFLPKDQENNVRPIRILKGALGSGVPHRDLYVSPAHAMYFEGTLIPANALINGVTITQVDLDRIDYFHVLLDQHDVLYAEGAATESYENHDNVKGFSNWAEYAQRFGEALPMEERDCFPRESQGPVVDRVRTALLEQAEALGFTKTEYPHLRLIADGDTLEAAWIEDFSYIFELPGKPSSLCLASLSVVPDGLLGNGDFRRLGVPLRHVTLRAQGVVVEVSLDYPGLTDGFYASEDTHCWTNGEAWLPTALFASLPEGPVEVEIYMHESGLNYYAPPATDEQAAYLAAAQEPLRASS